MQLLQVLGGVLGRGLHRLAEVLGHRVEPLVHPLLKLGVGVGQHLAHGLHARIELGDALLGGRVGDWRLRSQQQHDNGSDTGGDHQREDEEGGFRHGLTLLA